MEKTTFSREAKTLKALAHPKRLEIIHLLHQRVLTASEIQRMTGFPQANLSQHLASLKAGQIVVAVRTGKNIRYRLSHPNFWQVCKLLEENNEVRPAQEHESNRRQVQDPVCGMWIEPAATRWQTVYKGATYFFCASGCEQRFLKNSERYA